MDDGTQFDRIAKGIRGLSIAVWCLVAINGLQMAAWIVPFVAPGFYAKQVASMTMSSDPPMQKFESWEGLTLEQKVKRASLILITENKQENGKIRSIIKEELKRTPKTEFHYSVGDEYSPASILQPKADTRYGDGALVLFQGSPAMNHGSYAIYDGRIPGLGEIPVSKVREIVAASK